MVLSVGTPALGKVRHLLLRMSFVRGVSCASSYVQAWCHLVQFWIELAVDRRVLKAALDQVLGVSITGRVGSISAATDP